MLEQEPDRLIEVSWGAGAGVDAVYPAEVLIVSQDRPALLRDISEVFQREKVHITAMSSNAVKGDQHMRFRIEIRGAEELRRTLAGLREVKAFFRQDVSEVSIRFIRLFERRPKRGAPDERLERSTFF